MDLRRITDWTLLHGATIEIRHQGSPVCSGHVDAVTDDGKILWLRPNAQNRRLFEKAEHYEAWVADDRPGFHYEMTKALSEHAPVTSGSVTLAPQPHRLLGPTMNGQTGH
jgi:hypothetical protein